jgi:hypothetical protein
MANRATASWRAVAITASASAGPDDDAMGAFGFLLEAHKWNNLTLRLREFLPVGVRPLLIAVT